MEGIFIPRLSRKAFFFTTAAGLHSKDAGSFVMKRSGNRLKSILRRNIIERKHFIKYTQYAYKDGDLPDGFFFSPSDLWKTCFMPFG